MTRGSKSLSPAACYVSSGYNDDGDLVIILVEKTNKLTREIVLDSNGVAEVTLDRRLYNGTWNIDEQSDVWIDVSGGSFAFRLEIDGQISRQGSSSVVKSMPPTISTSGAVIVFDPPSNIRATPNGPILCSVTSRGAIPIQGRKGDWFETDYCGSLGYIHKGQVRF